MLLAIAVLLTAACSGNPTPTPSTEASPGPSVEASVEPSPEPSVLTCETPLKVGLVTDGHRIIDKGPNQYAYEGMESAANETTGCMATTYIESLSGSDYATNIAELVDGGNDVIIGVGSAMGDALGDAAKRNLDIKFVSVDGGPSVGHDESWLVNGESLVFAEDQVGYLAGVLAASVSKSNHIGVVGGLVAVPWVERFVEAYCDGARDTKAEITCDHTYTTSFDDAPQGEAAAKAMIDDGADVIFAAAGLTGNGALAAACDASALAIGTGTDQYETVPEARDCLLSSATKDIKGAVHDALFRIAAGEFVPGLHTDDIATGGVGLAPFHDLDADVTQTVKDLLAATSTGLADGSIVPDVIIDAQ